MSAVQPDDPREDTCNTHYELDVDSSHRRLQQDPRIGLLLLSVLVERERVLGLVLVNLVEDEEVGGHTRT